MCFTFSFIFIRIYLRLYVFVFNQILTKFGKILRIALGIGEQQCWLFVFFKARDQDFTYFLSSYIFDFKFQKEKNGEKIKY